MVCKVILASQHGVGFVSILQNESIGYSNTDYY
jgi:hypothetical protein